MLRVFSKKGMRDKVVWGNYFRVGPYVGKCVWNLLGFVIMKTK